MRIRCRFGSLSRMTFLMQFKVGDNKSSEIMLTGTLKADWIQLPVKRYLAVFPTLKQGVIAGVFKIKGASPGRLPGQRSYKSLCSFPLSNLWMIGIPGFMPCPQCGQMSP